MKPYLYPIIAVAAACGFASAQTTAYTTPVGYITHSIAGAGANPSADTYISASLVQASVFAGATTQTPTGGSVATFSGGVPAGLDATYVLEITSGASEGWWSTVLSSNSTSITVNDAFPASLPANTTISVRKHSTLKTLMGENAPGLITFNGVDANDEVQILNPDNQVVSAFAYVSGPDLADPQYPNGAWYDLVNSIVANDVVVDPGSSIKIKRVGATTLTFTSTGTVKTTKTQVDLFTDFNWVGTPLAAGGTLNGMQFNTQLNPFDGVNPNYDELQIVRPDQTVSPFAAADDGGLTMFDLVNSVPAGTEPFPEGAGVIIKRIGNPDSTITIPGTLVSP